MGGVAFALMVAISCFGALNGAFSSTSLVICGISRHADARPGSFFTSARLIYVAGKEGYLPAIFGRHNARLRTPLNAMCLQAALTITFIVIGGGFRRLINFAVMGAYNPIILRL